jgi:thiamine pyrophosphate-dependent acetolactate synthase large subunit-like protein
VGYLTPDQAHSPIYGASEHHFWFFRAAPGDQPADRVPEGPGLKSGPDPRFVSQTAALVAGERPVICAGQGIHYGKAWKQLRALAELLEAPVMTTLPGSAFLCL